MRLFVLQHVKLFLTLLIRLIPGKNKTVCALATTATSHLLEHKFHLMQTTFKVLGVPYWLKICASLFSVEPLRRRLNGRDREPFIFRQNEARKLQKGAVCSSKQLHFRNRENKLYKG
jgi:hypothetical protein